MDSITRRTIKLFRIAEEVVRPIVPIHPALSCFESPADFENRKSRRKNVFSIDFGRLSVLIIVVSLECGRPDDWPDDSGLLARAGWQAGSPAPGSFGRVD